MPELPSGRVTFVFTDVEASTRLLQEVGANAYAEALAEHRRRLRKAFAAHGGVEVDTQGDAFFYAFAQAADAVAGAAEAIAVLEGGPLRVRVGLHSGEPLVTSEGFVGVDVHRAARIAAAGHGGQVLLSQDTRDLVEGDFKELGEHRFKDFLEPVSIFQLGSREFPLLKTISNTNLPRPASSFVGREREMQELTALLTDGARFVTLKGPGGSGKTRLAIETALDLVPKFKAGVFWVELAPLREASLLLETIGRTIGAKDGVAEHIGERELLLVLDNFEQIVEAASELATLVERCPNLRLLVTTREVLRVRGEHVYSVPPLSEREAVELFCARAGVEPSGTVRALCSALEELPLALELAAARAIVLSPEQILARLSDRLDLLKGGRDADARQQTLRATIDWSYQLLTSEEQLLLARFSVFANGCTFAAAETVADAELDTLQSLIEKSLLRCTAERFSMLATIREFALERLEQASEASAARRCHALYFLALARHEDAALRAGEPEEGPVAALEDEIDNLRAAVEFGLETGETDLVREITAALPMYWSIRGRHGEAHAWLERSLALSDVEDDTRRRLLSGLALIAYEQGEDRLAISASDEAAILAMKLGGVGKRFELVKGQAFAALAKGELDHADELFEQGLRVADAADNGVGVSSCRLNLAYLANRMHRPDRAWTLLEENLPFVRARGQSRCEAYTLAVFGETLIYRNAPKEAGQYARRALSRAAAIDDKPLVAFCLDQIALSAAEEGDVERAALLLGATEAARETMGTAPDEQEQAIRTRATERIAKKTSVSEAWSKGRKLGLEKALALVNSDSA